MLKDEGLREENEVGQEIRTPGAQEVVRVMTARQWEQNSPTATAPITASPNGPSGWSACSVFLPVTN